jgi:hypothetical protein
MNSQRPTGSYTGPISLAWCDYSNTVRAMPANYLAADLTRIDASLWGREGEIGQLMAAAPAMLAALRLACDALTPANNPDEAEALKAMQAAIALATGAPAGEQAEAAPTCDDTGSDGLSTYRITETVTYLVMAEDEAHAERRFVCEVGISAKCFHAVEGRTIELVDESEFTCNGCGREEVECSADPCPDVIADRES